MASPRLRRVMLWTGVPVLALVVLVAVWSWAWFIPLVERQASAALGRPVTIGDLDVDLGRVTELVVGDLRIASPEGYPDDQPLAIVPRLAVRIDVAEFIRSRRIVIPDITVDQPMVNLIARAERDNNYTFGSGRADADGQPPADGAPSALPEIGALRVRDGRVHAQLAPLRSDMQLRVETREPEGQPASLHVTAEGRYADQPITGELVGGAVLSLRDENSPWPIRLNLANGPTEVALDGTVKDPLRFGGANIRLDFAGPDAALLTPLTGVPIPATPPYRLAGKLDYADGAIRFSDIDGKLGNTDINGTIAVVPRDPRPVVNATLKSRRVDLEDLAGFIGGAPKGKPEPAPNRGRVLPDTKVSVPRLQFADVHLTYDAGQIRGQAMPLDNMHVKLDIVDGAIAVHPLRFGVGQGRIDSQFDLSPAGEALALKGKVDFQRVDLSRLMGVTPMGEGQGAIGGSARIETRGRSLAEMLGQGDGGLTLAMAGGNLSALLVDLSGLQIGNAILSALGLPSRTRVQCFIADMALRRGTVSTRTMLIDTEDSLISGRGEIDLKAEKLDYALRTEAKHFTVGSLPTDILLRGTFSNPVVRPEVLELGARAGAAVGLGIIALPLAILPTIQLGIGEDNRCEGLVRRAK
ncbi:AsmA family protein [Teichococcus oryzae]|uniref:AsmA family protein n=1 Tax=Teichococcus oryzae TaxID=1608942 RepID=A0A5B2THL8_9PROT|nr:AsmA family protein [Pseudoroseomonas oryzae]KAA2213438.1 AsmA family protein [Pseudoroseomonas oryzae]